MLLGLLGCYLGTAAGGLAQVASDALPPDPWEMRGEAVLSRSAQREAEVHTWYALGIFAEENDGPEKALQIYRRVLDRHPGFLSLSLGVAQEFLRRGDFPAALATTKDAAKARPEAYLPEFVAAEIYYRHLAKPDMAERHAQKALRLAPREFAPYELLWEIHTHQGAISQANAVLDAAAAVTDASAEFYLSLAELHRRWETTDATAQARDTARRQTALRRAVAVAPENPEVLIRVADLYAIYLEVQEAAELYEKAHSLVPAWPFLRDKLTVALIEAGRRKEAIPYLQEMAAANPQDIHALDQLAQLCLEQNRLEEAILYLQKALLLQPQDVRRHHQLIDLLLGEQMLELAHIHLRRAMESFPRSGIFPYLQGATLMRMEKPEEAIRYFEQALAEAPFVRVSFVGGDFYFEYGVAAEQVGRYDLAAQLFRKAIEIDPANAARASNYLGYMWVERNENLDEAERLIRQALAAEPQNGAYLDSLGWLHYRRGNFAEALAVLLRAAEALSSPDPVVYEHIGDTYRALGRHPEALLFWQKALKLDADNVALNEKIEEFSARTAGAFPDPVHTLRNH